MPVTFNNLEQKKTLTFDDTAPDWRTVKRGVNFQGTCQNKSCDAYQEKVWAPKQFGKFNMHKVAYTCVCPMCSKVVSDVLNMSLYMCKCKVTGLKKGQEKETVNEYIHNDSNNCLSF